MKTKFNCAKHGRKLDKALAAFRKSNDSKSVLKAERLLNAAMFKFALFLTKNLEQNFVLHPIKDDYQFGAESIEYSFSQVIASADPAKSPHFDMQFVLRMSRAPKNGNYELVVGQTVCFVFGSDVFQSILSIYAPKLLALYQYPLYRKQECGK